MASKRKSTTPCMIPSKVVRPVEEVERDSAGQSRICGAGRRSPLDSGEPSQLEAGDAVDDGAGTYTCRPCDFETHDLNLFLDHVYSGHPDFRADPGFLCRNCGVSAPKFEGLALHNARVHPSTLNTSLHLRRRDRRAVVEQSLRPEAEAGKDGEISITKTPIMRMMKGKAESKRIVVSHPGSDEPAAPREPERKEAAVAVTHVPTIVHNGTSKVSLPSAIQIVNGSGALPMLKTPITQVVSVVQNRSHHQSTPTMASSNISSASYSTSKNLPKVMIPLSSIPTYSASMDSSSFLKTSFSKFPYPTKAELCYLTVVTKFPEEQIKIWFTAQRLKQGISWSPEEIEEARRKMFNTIIQTGPSGSQSQGHHAPAQHTITVLPASLGAAGIPHILQGSLVSQGGVIVTQPMMANGIQVSSAPVALAVTPKPQAAARPTMQARPAAAPVADKGVREVLVGTAGGGTACHMVSSSSAASQSGRDGSIITSSHAINLSLGSADPSRAAVSNAGNSRCDSGAKDAGGAAQSDAGGERREEEEARDVNAGGDGPKRNDDVDSDTGTEAASSPSSPAAHRGGTPVNAFLDPSFYKGKKSQEQLSALKDSFLRNQFPDQEEVDRLIATTALTVREVRKWFSDRRYHFRNLKGVRTGGQGRPGGGGGPGASGGCADGSTNPLDLSEGGGGGSAPLSPTPSQTPTSPTTPSRRHPRPPSPDFTAIRYKERDPHQLKALEASFVQDPDPPGEEVDRLRSETKMTRREIHGWFSDRRKRMAAEKKKEEAQRVMEGEETEADGEERQREDGSGELKVNPIKINLKMLKVTEANGKAEGDAPEAAAASSPGPPPSSAPTPKPAAIRGKKTAEQLQTLKLVYARTQWPSAAQYDDMLQATGLARPEVVRWFGDCRYVQKNGQLKWLEAFQTAALEEDLQKGDVEVLRAHYHAHGSAEESQLQDLAQSCGLTADLVRHWFSTQPGPEEKKMGAGEGGAGEGGRRSNKGRGGKP
ncbi:LOW QUALITY PROTEIN: zinc fingers and homeoboxes protein 3 [Pungitius pungitius]|uniref:LOW QUALITY PROTEIN: zinc fingers and homeoboxes protein 3 n=1 Tax=Pungitius pungitius TaxID=134920 RepID=UPI002E0FF66D